MSSPPAGCRLSRASSSGKLQAAALAIRASQSAAAREASAGTQNSSGTSGSGGGGGGVGAQNSSGGGGSKALSAGDWSQIRQRYMSKVEAERRAHQDGSGGPSLPCWMTAASR